MGGGLYGMRLLPWTVGRGGKIIGHDFEAAMGRITLYLDADTEEKMKTAAKAAGVSQSRWVSDLIREKIASLDKQRLAEIPESGET
jgi:hypothetical protein